MTKRYGLGTAFMDFTSGVIEADKQNSKENFLIRGKELEAKQKSIIEMKKHKWERDLEKYDKDKTRIDSLTSLKASFKNNEIDASTYGKSFIMETKGAAEVKNIMATFKSQKEIDDYFAVIGNSDPLRNDAVFKDFKTESVINANYEEAIEEINTKYSKALKAAKNDSSLVNAILGKKSEEIQNLSLDADKSKKDIALIDATDNTVNYIEKKEKKELDSIQADISGEAKEVETEEAGYTITNEPKKYGVPQKWIDDSKITDLRKEVKKNFNNTHKNMINTTLDTLSILNVPLPKQFLTFDTGENGAITGIKDSGKVVVEQTKLLTDQATNFMSNEWIYGQDKKASNVSNYYSDIAANKLLTSRVRDYSSEHTISQQKKGFWSDRENVVGFVPFSVVGLDNNFIYKYNAEGEGSGITIDAKDRKNVGKVYFETLKEIALAQDPGEGTFTDTTEATAINNLQDKLLKLHENQNPALLKLVKETMATKLGLMKPTVESTTEGSPTILTEEKDKEPIIPEVTSNKDKLFDIEMVSNKPGHKSAIIYLPTNEQPEGAVVEIGTYSQALKTLKYAKANNMNRTTIKKLEAHVKSLRTDIQRQYEEKNKSKSIMDIGKGQ